MTPDNVTHITPRDSKGEADPARPWEIELHPWLYNAIVRQGDILAAVVVAKLQPRCHVLADRAEVAAHPLPGRLQGLEAVGALVGVDADAFAVAVVDGDEDGLPLDQGDGLAHVGAPHDVHGLGGDGAVVRLVPAPCAADAASDRPAHRLDLRRAKGAPASRRAIFS